METDMIEGGIGTGCGVGGRGRRLRRKVDWPSSDGNGAKVCDITCRSPQLIIPVAEDKRTYELSLELEKG